MNYVSRKLAGLRSSEDYSKDFLRPTGEWIKLSFYWTPLSYKKCFADNVNPKKEQLFKKKNVEPPPSPYPRVAIIPFKCRQTASKLHNLCDLVPSH